MYSDLKERIKQILDTAEEDVNTQYPKWMYDDILGVCDEYEQKLSWSILWSPEDMQERAKDGYDFEMSEEDAISALEDMIHHHDCNYGITWQTVDEYVYRYKPETEEL